MAKQADARDLKSLGGKFVASSDSKDEDSFKTEILYAYIAAVRNDVSGENYKPVKCRDIASYLADSRVSEYLLREGGAISKCYNVITAPSNQILQDTTIFTDEDFNVSKIIRAVMKQGDPQASLFASSLPMPFGIVPEMAKKHDFKAFGWYRIVLGALVLVYFVGKTLLA